VAFFDMGFSFCRHAGGSKWRRVAPDLFLGAFSTQDDEKGDSRGPLK
jgi:hypothetical protein